MIKHYGLHVLVILLSVFVLRHACEVFTRALNFPWIAAMAVMSTHASILVNSVGPPSAEVCRTAASFP